MVKAFNNIYFEHLADWRARPARRTAAHSPIAGDDTTAKETVTKLLDELGYDTLDLGPLAEGWRTQRDTAAYGTPYAADAQDWSPGPADGRPRTCARRRPARQRYRDA